MVTHFPALLYPLGNWICLLFMAAVLVIMLMTPGMAISVYLIPVWLIVLGIGYLFEKTAKAVKRINLSSPSPALGEAAILHQRPVNRQWRNHHHDHERGFLRH